MAGMFVKLACFCLNMKQLKNDGGNIILTYAVAVPAAKPGYAMGCILINVATGNVYINGGTAVSCDFALVGTVGAGGIALANLAAGITPSHVVKYAGIALNGGGGAAFDIAIPGVVATDVIAVTLAASSNVVYLVKAISGTDKISVTLSGDPGASTKLHYSVLRAAA